MIPALRAGLLGTVLVSLGTLTCSKPGAPKGQTLRTPPPPSSSGAVQEDQASFEPVADAMQASCGSFDCHGQLGRNLRLFGMNGLRLPATLDRHLEAAGTPYLADIPTTEEEYEASYWSIVGLEPQVMSQVVRDGGEGAERLTLVRKALGFEPHKGGTVMAFNDPLDRCIQSWLEGSVDATRCRQSAPERPRLQP